MLDAKGFDGWADKYDDYVAGCDAKGEYPFADYAKVLGRIFEMVTGAPAGRAGSGERKSCDPAPDVLDLGFGTAVLTSGLYRAGCRISGQDFSARMVEIAKEKMPESDLWHGDFTESLAEPLRERKYDCIIATYALHHMSDEKKIGLITGLRGLLKPGGKIIVGDISFETAEAMERCRAEAGDEWDAEETYFRADDMKRVFPDAEYEKISFCAGVLTIPRD